MNLLEIQIRAGMVQNHLADAFSRLGFKTEGRLLKIQSTQLLALLKKAWAEMPEIDPTEAVAAILGGKETAGSPYYEKRRKRGKYYRQIGEADKVMLKTMRKAFESLYRDHHDWTRRKQLATTSLMMKAFMDVPREKVKGLLTASKSTS